MDGFYLAGEPRTNFEANLVIHFERHPDIIKDKNHSDYNFYEQAEPTIHASFK